MSHHTNMLLTLASRLALASLFFSHTPTCTRGGALLLCKMVTANLQQPGHTHSTTSQQNSPEPHLLLCGLPSSLHVGCQLCGGLGVA